MKYSEQKGFTLLELMITMAIIGVLASVAIPSYTQYVTRSNRSDAKDMLTNVMFEMERFSTRNRAYTLNVTNLGFANNPVLSNQGFYNISATACAAAPITTCVLLTATPVPGGRQANDGNVTLDSQGNRSLNWTN